MKTAGFVFNGIHTIQITPGTALVVPFGLPLILNLISLLVSGVIVDFKCWFNMQSGG